MVKANLGVEAACLFGSAAAAAALQKPGDRHHGSPKREFSQSAGNVEPVPAKRWNWQIWGPVILFFLAIVVLYGAASGTISSLPAYIRNSMEISTGYSEEMSLNGPFGQALMAVISMVVLFLLPVVEKPMRNLMAGFLPALIYAFFSFKSCMVRQDMHAADVELRIAMAALFLLVLARTMRFVYLALVFQAACVIVSHHYLSAGWPQIDAVVELRLMLKGQNAENYSHWASTWAEWERLGRQNLSSQRMDAGLRAAIGNKPIEVLPWDVTRVPANGWNWSPRPVFQPYQAVTPQLDRINAEYMTGPRAAEFALVSWGAIDGRHLFLETPFSWRTQLDLYQTIATDSDMLLLGRRPMPRFQATQRIGTETTTWDRVNHVPQSSDPVAVSAHISRSFSGRLRTMLFRSNPMFLEVTRQSGRSQRYRALRANFADGVIINQFPEDLGDLALLTSSGCALSDPVVSFRLITESPGEFDSNIRLEWERLIRRPDAPGSCIAITRTTAKAPVWGGQITVPVAAGAGISWSAKTSEPWISVREQEGPARLGELRTGNGVVDYAVLQNPGSGPRQGTVTIGGQSYQVLQAGRSAAPGNRIPVQFGYYGAVPSFAEPPRLPPNVDVASFDFPVFAVEGQPVLGDWTGDGRMRIGVFRDGLWYLDLNGNGRWDGKEGGDGIFSFGLAGDIAVPGDWAGDGKTRLGVFRHGEWAFDTNGNMAFDFGGVDQFVQYGLTGDIPVVGKWGRDGKDHVGIFRKGEWFLDSNGNGVFERTDESFTFGLPGDLPMVSFGNGRIGAFRKGTCILSPNDSRRFDVNAVLKIPCGANRPMIAAW